MGQQQLLLLVAGIIITMAAFVTGISMFSSSQESAVYDDLSQEAVRLATQLVAWKNTPAAMGGGMNVQYATGLDFGQLGVEGGTGDKAHSGSFRRWLKTPATKRPYFRVQSDANRDLRVDVMIYGTDSNCFKMRRWRRVDGSWISSGLAVGKNKAPEGCITW